ncbi:MAG: hypothetical protein R3214_08025 [Christiangramia sp.]|nr:hypothetical protein [Christiangramia sp.]
MQKAIQKIIFLLIMSLHFIFLTGILIDNFNHPFPALSLIPISGLLIYFYFKTEKNYPKFLRKRDLLTVQAVTLGAIITYFLHVEFQLGVVLAAGIVGLIGSLIPYLKKGSGLLREVPAAMYCGAFAGMTAPGLANGYLFIFYAGMLTGILLVLAKNMFIGYGGKLGTLAFGGVSIVYSVIYLFT